MNQPNDQEDLQRRFIEQVEGRDKRSYSDGRLNANDDGDLAAVVVVDRAKKKIILDFGKPVPWVAMTPEQAATFGQFLIARAVEMSDKPITITLPPPDEIYRDDASSTVPPPPGPPPV